MKKATALALLALAPALLAACGSDGGNLSGSAVEDPSKPADPGAPPVAPVNPPAEKPGESKPAPGGASGTSTDCPSLTAFVEGLAPTRRVDLADMRDACRASDQGKADIAAFETYLKTLCPTEADCKDAVGMLLYKERSPQQVAQQIYPASNPQVKDVLPIIEKALGPDAGGDASGDPGAAPVSDEAYDGALDKLADDLGGQGDAMVNMVQIGDLIIKIDPETGTAVTTQLTKDVADIDTDDATIQDTADKLAAGDSVPASDAAKVIEEVSKGDSGDSAEKPGAGTAGAVADALHKAADSLRQGVGMTVAWEGVKTMLGDDAAAAVEGSAGDTNLVNADTLKDLLDGKNVDAGQVADLLDEVANAANP